MNENATDLMSGSRYPGIHWFYMHKTLVRMHSAAIKHTKPGSRYSGLKSHYTSPCLRRISWSIPVAGCLKMNNKSCSRWFKSHLQMKYRVKFSPSLISLLTHTERAGITVTIQSHIRRCLVRMSVGISAIFSNYYVILGKCLYSTQIRPWTFPSKYFPIKYSYITLPFQTILSKY